MMQFNESDSTVTIYMRPTPPSPPTEFNNSLPELLCSDDDSGNEDVLDMEYTEAEAESLKRNAEVSARPHRVDMRCTRCTCSHKNQTRSAIFLNFLNFLNFWILWILLITEYLPLCCIWSFLSINNLQTGDLANSFRLISVVSHIGSTSSSGIQMFFSSFLKCCVTALEPVCENKNKNLAVVSF